MSHLLRDLFQRERPLIGMVHLLPLPGAPRYGGSMAAVLERALADAGKLEAAGLDGIIVENYGDLPFYPERVPAETVAAVAVCVREVVRAVRVPVGVNLLRNDACGALAIAHAAGGRFIRVNVHSGAMLADQGVLTGAAHETLRLRRQLGAEVRIFADVWVKHATPLPGVELEQAAQDTCRRGLADALIVSGSGTGKPVDPVRIDLVKQAVPEMPVLVGSGVTAESVSELLGLADGAIVGSALQREGVAGSEVDSERATRLLAALRS